MFPGDNRLQFAHEDFSQKRYLGRGVKRKFIFLLILALET